jgi:TetR/AcrR family transcriptional repressor of nem operon
VRYASDHKAETRERVLKAAAREIRAKGPDGVAVAGVMARAGLTHGGFYAHFASKDALVEAALDTMFTSAGWRADRLADEEDPRMVLADYLAFYLSTGHRDTRERGCPLPSLSGDFARTESVGRTRFGKGMAGLSGRLATVLARLDVTDPRAEANALLAQLVGAVALARATDDAAQSDAILADTRATLARRYDLKLAA